jgi:hypothetical protein
MVGDPDDNQLELNELFEDSIKKKSFSKGLGLPGLVPPLLGAALDVTEARCIPLSMVSASAEASEDSIRRLRIALLGESDGSSLASSES